MSKYALEYVDGRVTEIVADNDTEAELIACRHIGGDAVAADQWDDDGVNDDGDRCEHLHIWADEDSSIGDDGVESVAKLTVVRD